jgi:hypothetical protein
MKHSYFGVAGSCISHQVTYRISIKSLIFYLFQQCLILYLSLSQNNPVHTSLPISLRSILGVFTQLHHARPSVGMDQHGPH